MTSLKPIIHGFSKYVSFQHCSPDFLDCGDDRYCDILSFSCKPKLGANGTCEQNIECLSNICEEDPDTTDIKTCKEKNTDDGSDNGALVGSSEGSASWMSMSAPAAIAEISVHDLP